LVSLVVPPVRLDPNPNPNPNPNQVQLLALS